jgi:hypothetical protein
MRRTHLERRLMDLGWRNTGEMSGERHVYWSHPRKPRRISVPVEDFVIDAVAERIIRLAGG